MITQDEDIVDLREDPLSYPVQCTERNEHNDFIDLRLDRFPVQCTDADVHNAEPTDDFVDLTLDVNPVQCTEPSEPNMNIPRCTRTLTDCLDIPLREFHAHVCSQHQQ